MGTTYTKPSHDMLLSPSGRWHSPCKRDGGIRACVRIAPRAPYTNVTQMAEFRSDTSAVVGSTPTISTMLPWDADPLITTGGDRLENRLR